MTKQEMDAELAALFKTVNQSYVDKFKAALAARGLRIVPDEPVASRMKCRRKTSDGFWTEDWQYSNQQHGDTKPLYADPES